MEFIKNPKADIHKKRLFFMSIGLALSLTVVIVAFEWKQYDDSLVNLGELTDNFEDELEVPPTEQPPPPPPPPIIPPEIIEVPDEEEIEEEIVEIDLEFDESEVLEEIVVEEEEVDEIFLVVEEQPSPIGGMPAFYGCVKNNLRYPVQATRMGIEGKVYVDFIVEKDGTLTNVGILKGVGGGCDEEAARVVRECPVKWKPGKQRGKPVRVRFRLPITFRLN